MRSDDISSAIRLTNQEKWGVTRSDLQRILQLNPRGSFIAADGARRLGLITTTSYGKKLAWIGNVIVDKQHRNKRIGRTLVEHAVNYLRESEIKHIGLYCFEENARFYRNLGFVRDNPFVRLRREPKTFGSPPSALETQRMAPLRALLAADKKVFGADRSRLIRSVLAIKGNWYVCFSHGRSSGAYLLVKPSREMYELGPWICVKPRKDEPKQMLQSVLSKTAKKPIEVACVRSNTEALGLLRGHGFRVIREGYRMYWKQRVSIGDVESNYALGFLDKG